MTPLQKMALAMELHEAGVDLVRQRLRRDHPSETDLEIEARVGAWLRSAPMDAPGPRIPYTR